MFENLARDTCEGDGSVISSFLLRLWSILYPDHIHGEPVFGEASIPKRFSEYICQNCC